MNPDLFKYLAAKVIEFGLVNDTDFIKIKKFQLDIFFNNLRALRQSLVWSRHISPPQINIYFLQENIVNFKTINFKF